MAVPCAGKALSSGAVMKLKMGSTTVQQSRKPTGGDEAAHQAPAQLVEMIHEAHGLFFGLGRPAGTGSSRGRRDGRLARVITSLRRGSGHGIRSRSCRIRQRVGRGFCRCGAASSAWASGAGAAGCSTGAGLPRLRPGPGKYLGQRAVRRRFRDSGFPVLSRGHGAFLFGQGARLFRFRSGGYDRSGFFPQPLRADLHLLRPFAGPQKRGSILFGES